MHLVYSQGEEVTPENDGIELDTDEGCLHRLYRAHTFQTFKEKYGVPDAKYFMFDLTTGEFTENQELFMVSLYFIMPYGNIVFTFGEHL
jgi:hypothetical protein